MPKMIKNNTKEIFIYVSFWVVMYTAPVLSLYMRMMGDSRLGFDWTEIGSAWAYMSIMLALFVVHNHFVAPILVRRRKTVYYVSITILLIALFTAAQYVCRPKSMGHHRPKLPPREIRHGDVCDGSDRQCMHCRNVMLDKKKYRPQPQPRRLQGDDMEFHPDMPLLNFGPLELMSALCGVLLLGMNLGVKFYFKSEKDSEKLSLLEKQNLEQNLKYLKYQVNPHFFMNTLNNIHALVDIDPERAKTSIVELSKMMRYILYEGNNKLIPLPREVQFLRNYVMLMRLRYPKKVDITMEAPEAVPDKMLPPLLFIIFVENSFKHGISYRNASFVHISIKVDGDFVEFSCRNSKNSQGDDEHGGVGLANVKKRLELLFAENYTLDINDGETEYDVFLRIPLAPPAAAADKG